MLMQEWCAAASRNMLILLLTMYEESNGGSSFDPVAELHMAQKLMICSAEFYLIIKFFIHNLCWTMFRKGKLISLSMWLVQMHENRSLSNSLKWESSTANQAKFWTQSTRRKYGIMCQARDPAMLLFRRGIWLLLS